MKSTQALRYIKWQKALVMICLVFAGVNIGLYNDVSATQSSLSMTIDNNVLSVDVMPAYDGVFAKSGNSTITVSTNHFTGYTLSIKAQNAPNLTDGNNHTIDSIATTLDESVFSSSSTYNGKCGYMLNKSGLTPNTNFRPLPSVSGDVLDSTNSANTTPQAYTLAIGTRIGIDTVPGTYSNTFVISVLVNPITFSIYYTNATGVTGVSNMPNDTLSGITFDETATLSSTVPIRNGYTFDGWCTMEPVTVGDNDTCAGATYAAGATNFPIDQTSGNNSYTLYTMWRKACDAGHICYDGNGATAGEMGKYPASANTSLMLRGYNFKRTGYGFLGWSTVANPVIGTDTIYGPMETITTPSTLGSYGLTLYAVWLPKSTVYVMQDFTDTVCTNELTQITYNTATAEFTFVANSFIALEDARDGNVYAVARLTDGNCWMLENLRLDETVSASLIANGSQGYGGVFTKLANSEDTFPAYAAPNSLYSTGNIATMPRYNRNNTNFGGTNASGVNLVAGYDTNNNYALWYGYGNYYSWAAAKANTTSIAGIANSNNIATSICPLGWRLPMGSPANNFSFSALSVSMGGLSGNMVTNTTPTGAVMSGRVREFPNNFVYGGSLFGNSFIDRGTAGFYWTTTAPDNDASKGYRLYINDATVQVVAYVEKTYGFPARCVAGTQ